MTRRKSSDEVDSLELLLDTICNIFGGIIFIAILVTLLTSAQTKMVCESSPHAARDGDLEVAAIEASAEQYEVATEQLHRTTSIVDENDADRARRVMDALTQGQQDVDARVRLAEQWLQEYERLVRDKTLQVDDQLAKARDRLVSLEVKIRESKKANTIEARLPVERATNRRQVLFLLSGGRVYWIPLGKSTDMFPAEYSSDVSIERSTAHWAIHPKVGGGFPLDGHWQDHARMRLIMRTMRVDADFFHLFIHPDSVEAFHKFKDVILQHGFRYNVVPVESGKPLILVPTDTVNIQ